MKLFLGPGIFLITLAGILWAIGRIDAQGPRSARYADFQPDESKLLIPLLALLGLIATGIGLYGYFFA